MLDTQVWVATLRYGYGESSHVGIFGSMLGAQRGCEVHAGDQVMGEFHWVVGDLVPDSATATHPDYEAWTYSVTQSHICRRYDEDGEFCTICDMAGVR